MNGLESAQAEGAREVRRGWIIFFGVLELLIGAILGLMSVLIIIFALFSADIFKTPIASRGGVALVFPILFYGAAAFAFLLAGAGTLGRRRWARMLMLVVSWFWLVFGILGGAMVLFMIPLILEQTARGGQAVSSEIRSLVWILVGGGTVFFSVVLPGSFLVFYTRRSVKAAFEQRESEEPPRRKLPLLVAILAIWIGFCAIASLCSVPYGLLVLFGFFIRGVRAILLGLINAGFQGFLAWRIVRREEKVWWAAFIYFLLLGISAAVTMFRVSMNELFAALGSSQIVDSVQNQVMQVVQSYLPWFTLIGQVLFLGLILCTKRYFRPHADTAEPLTIS